MGKGPDDGRHDRGYLKSQSIDALHQQRPMGHLSLWGC
jgi:hypothetical protein